MENQKHVGLLQKANLLNQKKGLAFSEFIVKHNIKTCALFTPINNAYFIKQSIGFDAVSICYSSSTKDFWNGLINKINTPYTFSTSQKNISSVLQFFSIKIKDEIDFVTVYKTSNENILMLCNKELTPNIISDIKSLNEDSEYFINFDNQIAEITSDTILTMIKIDSSNAAKKIRDANCTNNILVEKFAEKSINNEIHNRLAVHYSAPHFCKRSSISESRIIVTSKTDMPDELIISHLKNDIKSVLDNNTENLEISALGKCQSISQIKDFLKA